ncbi:MAG: thioredoxin domain-containing protein [Rhizobiales bacterium]|nr:thioredoxin domain-containing protein [Hyphomicrobiales bacterium]
MTRNQLAHESSPYLLQHKDNPVHWQPWSPKAFETARDRNKPVFLSIGYAACHWCHVMAHESFEDPETAFFLNANFISIKVDREERPDIDKIYMQALLALGQQGGWPLSIFLDPEARPFWGGTYFPPDYRYGRPSFRHILREISRIWQTEPHKITSTAGALTQLLVEQARPRSTHIVSLPNIHTAADTIARAMDPIFGGLQGAPKFPQFPLLNFLWSDAQRRGVPYGAGLVETTLLHLCQGGIYDHLAGGIARYSVDSRWLVPHFEKMLPDNAQFGSLLTRAWLQTGNLTFHDRLQSTLSFILTEMRTPEGLFGSSYDADSDGEEGRYYVWHRDEIYEHLDPATAELFCEYYDVSPAGNWDGYNILNRLNHLAPADPSTEQILGRARSTLLDAKKTRSRPSYDDKVLTDWNALTIRALAEAALALTSPTWSDAAIQSFQNLLAIHHQDGHLRHSSRGTRLGHTANADDYAQLISAARALHTLTGEQSYISNATTLAEQLVCNYWDSTTCSLTLAPLASSDLPAQIISIVDDATPNANALMIGNFTALHHITGERRWLQLAENIAATFAEQAIANPFGAATYFTSVAELFDPLQVVIAGNVPAELLTATISLCGLDAIFNRAVDQIPQSHPAYGKAASSDKGAVYLCRGQTCAAPSRNIEELFAAAALLGIRDTRSGVH